MTTYEQVLRPILYRLGGGDAETAHERTLRWLRRVSSRPAALAALRRMYGVLPAGATRTVFGIRFPGPVGLAAGMDKDGVALPAWRALGFGFAEVGTVTPEAQEGNPRPRLFRLTGSQAVINRMGFNNQGSAALAERLHGYGDLGFPVGVSIGKSKGTPLSDAVEDYAVSLRRLYRYGDYFAVNVSSPNTPGLRSLQDAGWLRELLTALRAEAVGLSETFSRSVALSIGQPADEPKPLLVKIAPDLTEAAIDELLQVCADTKVAGIIATNTTIARDGVAAAEQSLAAQTGGLSGRPLTERSRRIVAHIHQETGGALPVIGVGGVLTPDDALRLFDAGADLVQLYTGLVYRGPALVRGINAAVAPAGVPGGVRR